MENIWEYIKEPFVSENVSRLHWFIVCGFGLGTVLGLIVLTIGLVNKKTKLAVWGFLAAVVTCAGCGIILSLPVSIIFIIFILKNGRDELLDAEDEEENLDDIELTEDDFKDEEK